MNVMAGPATKVVGSDVTMSGQTGDISSSALLDDMVRAASGRPFPHFSQPAEVRVTTTHMITRS